MADFAALIAAFSAAFVLAMAINEFYLQRSLKPLTSDEWLTRLTQVGLLSSGIFLWFKHAGHYRTRMPFWIEVREVFSTLAFAMLVDSFFQFAGKQDFSRSLLILGWGMAGFFIVAIRALARNFLRRAGKWDIATLLIGNGPLAYDARSAIQADRNLGYKIVAQIDDLPSALAQHSYSWTELCAAYQAQYVCVALEGLSLTMAEPHITDLMRENVPFAVVPPMRHFPVHGMRPYYFFNHNVLLWMRASGLENRLSQYVKRGTDIALSGATLLVLSPLLLLIAALIKLDSGPAFYPDERIGRNGKRFKCLKFRTMVTNSDKVLHDYLAAAPKAVKEEWLAYKKLRNDPRVTKVGTILRKTSLDELPQLINVLIGNMSLVGPRPIMPRELDSYADDIMLYCKVRPGITGLWQVSGRNLVTYAKRVEMDSWYVRNWSLWHDIVILCKTFPVLLHRKGAF